MLILRQRVDTSDAELPRRATVVRRDAAIDTMTFRRTTRRHDVVAPLCRLSAAITRSFAASLPIYDALRAMFTRFMLYAL